MWIILLVLGVGVTIVATFRWFQGRRRQVDLGYVSHQWVAEHRLSQTQESQR